MKTKSLVAGWGFLLLFVVRRQFSVLSRHNVQASLRCQMLQGYGEFLYQTGMIDDFQKQYVDKQTDFGVQLIQQQKWVEAFEVFYVPVKDFILNCSLNQIQTLHCSQSENTWFCPLTLGV